MFPEVADEADTQEESSGCSEDTGSVFLFLAYTGPSSPFLS